MISSPLVDAHGRPLSNLRISVTDRCNLRCAYCMPEEEYVWLAREHILTFEEICALVDAFAHVGVDRVRLTGGEPLLRRDLDELVAMLAQKPAIRDLALTTNGLLLAEQADSLKRAGLHRVTVSLDTLQPERFKTLTRRDGHERVLDGIAAATSAGFTHLKIDTVLIRGTNEDELAPMIEFGKTHGAEVRFIEYMDVGGATRWSPEQVFPRTEMLARLAQTYGPITPIQDESTAPAERFMLPDGTVFGIIASTTAPFCSSCDRSRLTADGTWYRCLYAKQGTDLRQPLRQGATQVELASLIADIWRTRTDRGAEDRLRQEPREPLVQITQLRRDPHLEMHTRGG
jgi:cyclic pyranopterin phosphate synthase